MRNRYLELARAAPARFRVVDATQKLDQVCEAARRGTREGARPRARCRRDEHASTATMVRPAPCGEVVAAFAAGRLAHGLLIHEDPGAGGSGTRALDRAAGQLPRTRSRAPCGECQQCRWIAADQHPDVTRLSPAGRIAVHPHRGGARAHRRPVAHSAWQGYKVAILSPADALHSMPRKRCSRLSKNRRRAPCCCW